MPGSPRSSGSKPPAAPRWVKVSAIIVAAVVVLVVVVALVGGGDHGPNRHLPEEDNHRSHRPPVRHGP